MLFWFLESVCTTLVLALRLTLSKSFHAMYRARSCWVSVSITWMALKNPPAPCLFFNGTWYVWAISNPSVKIAEAMLLTFLRWFGESGVAKIPNPCGQKMRCACNWSLINVSLLSSRAARTVGESSHPSKLSFCSYTHAQKNLWAQVLYAQVCKTLLYEYEVRVCPKCASLMTSIRFFGPTSSL